MKTQQTLVYLVPVMGMVLLVWLVLRTGTATVFQEIKTIGWWGFGLVLLLGGLSHLIKTWSWRLSFQCDIRNVSFARTLGLRLISEAIAILGLPGQVLGEAARVSLLGSDVPMANSISSVTLDRGLYIATSAVVSFAGMIAALLLLSLSHKWRVYALLSALGSAVLLAACGVAILKRWTVFSGMARAIGRLGWIKTWLDGKQSVIEVAENNLFDFYRKTPGIFWGTLVLNLASHATAILEVYVLLFFMGTRKSLMVALVVEALTKLINIVGTLNPGNVGTFEGGNMIVARLIHISAGAGLTIALCRRVRILFWAAIGAICLTVMSKSRQRKMVLTEATTFSNGSVPLLS
ncbi:MAG: lysylphosphatidylglycerol synthase transmembrane domain-containing protein [Candidatus Sulfotelmatobacter sp.]